MRSESHLHVLHLTLHMPQSGSLQRASGAVRRGLSQRLNLFCNIQAEARPGDTTMDAFDHDAFNHVPWRSACMINDT